MENFRELLYPLGYIASITFGLRFLLQWAASEIERRSVVSKSFWRLSLIGNMTLLIHALIQSQFHICVVQTFNAVISWRNLNFMEAPSQQVSFKTVLKLLIGSFLGLCALFFLIAFIESSFADIEWFRLPNNTGKKINFSWHLLGSFGLVLFSTRFWIQWWHAEQNKISQLNLSFWWLSLIGGLLSLIYFTKIDDPVNIIGPAVGLIPYIRNIMLMNQKQKPLTT
jgi:lipid-A-disaccharide synthase-like uncharacterized protein